jgi:hypothetical protein
MMWSLEPYSSAIVHSTRVTLFQPSIYAGDINNADININDVADTVLVSLASGNEREDIAARITHL